MFNKNLLVILFGLLLAPFLYSQEDSTKSTEDWDWHWTWHDWEEWKDWSYVFTKSRPAISLQYGIAQMNRTDMESEFVNPNLMELKLGYIKERPAWNTENIIVHSYKYLYLSNESNKLAGKEPVGMEIASNMWRFGFGSSSGYGYKLGEHSAIIPYYTFTINWSDIDFEYDSSANIPPSDINILNYYDDSFRFGTSSEGGVRVQVLNNLMLEGGYERSIVFQRLLFWKWAGSALIEVASQGILDGFIKNIFKSSPQAGPIVNFVLKNALAYGLYELRQDEMNWPFPSEPPIAYDQFKFGMTFVF